MSQRAPGVAASVQIASPTQDRSRQRRGTKSRARRSMCMAYLGRRADRSLGLTATGNRAGFFRHGARRARQVWGRPANGAGYSAYQAAYVPPQSRVNECNVKPGTVSPRRDHGARRIPVRWDTGPGITAGVSLQRRCSGARTSPESSCAVAVRRGDGGPAGLRSPAARTRTCTKSG